MVVIPRTRYVSQRCIDIFWGSVFFWYFSDFFCLWLDNFLILFRGSLPTRGRSYLSTKLQVSGGNKLKRQTRRAKPTAQVFTKYIYISYCKNNREHIPTILRLRRVNERVPSFKNYSCQNVLRVPLSLTGVARLPSAPQYSRCVCMYQVYLWCVFPTRGQGAASIGKGARLYRFPPPSKRTSVLN